MLDCLPDKTQGDVHAPFSVRLPRYIMMQPQPLQKNQPILLRKSHNPLPNKRLRHLRRARQEQEEQAGNKKGHEPFNYSHS